VRKSLADLRRADIRRIDLIEDAGETDRGLTDWRESDPVRHSQSWRARRADPIEHASG
jgi:hypothetical protein